MKLMSYTTLDKRLYINSSPRKPERPEMLVYNEKLARELGLEHLNKSIAYLTAIFSGQVPFENTSPIVQAYGGHQFGHFTILGDGRAHLIGEITLPNGEIVDCMLKGSGKTPYSRGGDGLAALGPMLREYIISEAMAALNIPTSRSLAVIKTNEKVYREKPLNGAILTRVASSHIRVGTFQYAATLKDFNALKGLTDYCIHRHFRKEIEIEGNRNGSQYLIFFREVLNRQAKLIAKWLAVGFIHGVMNTDNMSISGETIDYGPCAFMNTYDSKTVYSSIDTGGRYAYGNQHYIGAWNLARLGDTLIPLIDEDKNTALEQLNQVIGEFEQIFTKEYAKAMGKKLGFGDFQEGDEHLISTLLKWMEEYKADFTNTFRDLTTGQLDKLPFVQVSDFDIWYSRVTQRQMQVYTSRTQVEDDMKSVNPAFIPRNHLVEEALLMATEKKSMDYFNRLLDLVTRPFEYSKEQLAYTQPESGYDENYKTYCGT